MDKQEKQNISTVVIVIAVVVIVMVIGFGLYPSLTNKEEEKITPTTSENSDEEDTNANTNQQEDQEDNVKKEETVTPEEEENNYVGQEEQESNEEADVAKTKDEKAIELAKKEWGENDTSVTYSIEQKDGNIYYIAVKSNATVEQWYEVDTENWTIKEY